MANERYGLDDDDLGGGERSAGPTEFDCPECNANNPLDEPIAEGVEVRCYYCGEEFRAHFTQEGRLKLRLQ